MARIFYKPASGLAIYNPATRKPLPEAGDWIESSTYWARRLAAQDVTEDTEAQLKREADLAVADEKAEAEAAALADKPGKPASKKDVA